MIEKIGESVMVMDLLGYLGLIGVLSVFAFHTLSWI